MAADAMVFCTANRRGRVVALKIEQLYVAAKDRTAATGDWRGAVLVRKPPAVTAGAVLIFFRLPDLVVLRHFFFMIGRLRGRAPRHSSLALCQLK